ncbi:hypothetical protein DFP72DRAFT_223996 [Ephemerocybe angulata]|uniref:Uncharacterized protein n=1 Tax=Ephemerocybe angulata TaxID=980116 RepID=A0A8H6I2U1_9AGAR|nr:hypothetical protein DFP72DRAFT_223996 [Tulosesus angulatus]
MWRVRMSRYDRDGTALAFFRRIVHVPTSANLPLPLSKQILGEEEVGCSPVSDLYHFLLVAVPRPLYLNPSIRLPGSFPPPTSYYAYPSSNSNSIKSIHPLTKIRMPYSYSTHISILAHLPFHIIVLHRFRAFLVPLFFCYFLLPPTPIPHSSIHPVSHILIPPPPPIIHLHFCLSLSSFIHFFLPTLDALVCVVILQFRYTYFLASLYSVYLCGVAGL